MVITATNFYYLNIGAGNQVRTGDLNLGKVALYQLSYSRTDLRILGFSDHAVKHSDEIF